MCQSHPIVMNFLLKKYLKFAKKEENSHECRRKLRLKIIYFFFNFKINDHQSMIIYKSILLKKENKITILSWFFFCGNYERKEEKNHVTSVFLPYFFSLFLKNMAMRLV